MTTGLTTDDRLTDVGKQRLALDEPRIIWTLFITEITGQNLRVVWCIVQLR